MLLSVCLIIVGFILLIKGADFLVDGASSIARKFNIPQIVIGLTIVSIGTSMPELFVSITSAMEGYSDMALGNVIGSNLCNLLLILGLSAIIMPIQFKRETRLIEIPVCLFVTFIFGVFCNTGLMISRIETYILIILFIIFILYTIVMAIKGKDIEENDIEDIKEISILKSLLNIFIGIIALKIGGDFTVDNAVVVAEHLNISEKIISLTILAIGTSLPELVTSITAALKRNSDIAIGNILGSNIFNMLLIIGVSSLIEPIIYNTSYNIDCIILFWSTLLLSIFAIVPPKNQMNRTNGIIYVVLYVIYMAIFLPLIT